MVHLMAKNSIEASTTIEAIEELGMAGDVVVGCFDLSPAIVQGVIDGTVAYAIDQQQFLQGYMPIIVLNLMHRNGTLPGNSINSGPGFVTLANVAQVQALAGVER